jgi:hypothetical protein
MRRSAGHVGQETLQPAGRTILLGECVMVHPCPPTPGQGLVHNAHGVAAGVIK